MGSELAILAATAATIGFVHTLTGPDHYLPFIVIGKARNWSLGRTLGVTTLCGIGHVLGSVVLGLVGIGLGMAVGRLDIIEGVRGDIAAWLLISFGLIYAVWGLRKAMRDKPHTHVHQHSNGSAHTHHHSHHHEHSHVHDDEGAGSRRNLTPWALFIIFVLGPCEPLIPILMYPAATSSFWGLVLVTGIFAVVTIGTMLMMVYLAQRGIRLIPMQRIERYTHAIAGVAILSSGLAIRFLGL
ncbi:MAG: sulfite exporter TauE/SafE family protein [Candidatus Krumholzibacteria bacterium]|nr:sulfite exporter TauE/SafE family protein [Candidatus Krumholzibacteria bacterium]